MINNTTVNGIFAQQPAPAKLILEPSTSSPLVAKQSRIENAASSTVTISPEALNALMAEEARDQKAQEEDLKQGLSYLAQQIKTDPDFAEEMAYLHAHTRDGGVISLADIPLDGRPTARFQTMAEYRNYNDKFEQTAEDLMNARQAIYSRMKAEGASGADIYEKLMTFNQNLALDYQKAARLDVIARSYFGS